MGKIAASASRIGNIIYIIGGYHVFANNTEESSDRVHRYDIANNTYLTDGLSIRMIQQILPGLSKPSELMSKVIGSLRLKAKAKLSSNKKVHRTGSVCNY